MAVGDILWIILVGTPVIGVLVIVHEAGHFILAKLCGVGVVKFSIGFGPAILRARWGETIYQIGAIPLGGFVRMVGDIPDGLTGDQSSDDEVRKLDEMSDKEREALKVSEEMFKDRSRWFVEKSLWQKFLIVFAGPLANFILPIVLVACAGYYYGQEDISDEPVIGSVSAGEPAERAGLLAGDRVLSLNGVEVASWVSLAKTIHQSTGEPVSLVIGRNGETLSLDITPVRRNIPDFETGGKKEVSIIGISPATTLTEIGLRDALEFGVLWTIDKTMLTYVGLGAIVTGRASPKDLAGPIFIFEAAGKEAEKGFKNIVFFVSLLSVSLAVLNLLPIPILDGGHLLFFLVESLIGPISLRKKEFAQQIGLCLLLCLMVFAVYNDLTRGENDLGRGAPGNQAPESKAQEAR